MTRLQKSVEVRPVLENVVQQSHNTRTGGMLQQNQSQMISSAALSLYLPTASRRRLARYGNGREVDL